MLLFIHLKLELLTHSPASVGIDFRRQIWCIKSIPTLKVKIFINTEAHNLGIQMNRKELAKKFMKILTWKTVWSAWFIQKYLSAVIELWGLKGLVNPFKPEFTIVIFIHYKPRIAVAILDL